MKPLTLTVYLRTECHLCHDLLSELRPWQEQYGFSVDTVDIDSSPTLQARYLTRVPVLAAGETEICYYFLEEDKLREFLDANSA